LAAKRAEARKQGGLKRRYQDCRPEGESQLESVGDILAGLRYVLKATWQQDNTAERSRALISGYSAALQALQVGSFEDRIKALEERVAELKPSGSSGGGTPAR
jgi:hypothetical protein